MGGETASERRRFDELIGLDSSDLRPDEVGRYVLRFRELLVRELCAPRPDHWAMNDVQRAAPRFEKTHDAYRAGNGRARFPHVGAVGVVYLVRNPLDVVVSFAHYMRKRVDSAVLLMNDPDAYIYIQIGLPCPLTTWSGHVSSWLDQTDLPTHTVRYEDLLADPRATFGAIARFVGLGADAARLARAIEHAAFHRLRAQEIETGFDERRPGVPAFFRSGVAGAWRKVLTRAQVKALVDVHAPIMDRLGYLDEAESFLSGRVP